MDLHGIHHVTAVTANVRGNFGFYTGVLGMRLVKRTVNQDDVSAYHLFYADAVGSPGTDLTFFDWTLPRERRGTRSISRTHLRVDGADTLAWWASRLSERGVSAADPGERDGRLVLDFEDPEGQRLTLIDDGGTGDEPRAWPDGPVPVEHQIRGLGPVVLSVPDPAPTDAVLRGVLGMRQSRTYTFDGAVGSEVLVYEMGPGGASAEVHLAVTPDLPVARLGAGGVHHVAFRTPSREDQRSWTERLDSLGVPNSGEVDRFYFRSLYFREPNGILFEIATDGPGFGVDEDPATLGEKVALPPFLEPRRDAILANLAPID